MLLHAAGLLFDTAAPFAGVVLHMLLWGSFFGVLFNLKALCEFRPRKTQQKRSHKHVKTVQRQLLKYKVGTETREVHSKLRNKHYVYQ